MPPTSPNPSTPTNFEGCSHGFWKNHPSKWSTYSTSQTVGSVFTGLPPAISSLTLLKALKQSGGGLNALTREAIAALLNAAQPGVDYPLTTGEVVDMVNQAIASGNKSTIESLKDTLETFNNRGAKGFC
jgi:hypothetical protein